MAAKFSHQRKIGDAFVPALGLGCMSLSIGAHNDQECLDILTQAADMGLTFWVTSDAYGPFDNEKLLGRWFKETGRRDEIFLATKFGVKVNPDRRGATYCGTPEHVKEACDASLERLNADRIDLYLQHRVDVNTPIEKTVEAMADLKKQGKIRYLGLSECSAKTLRRANKVHPIAAAEMEFSPFALEIESPETGFLEAARELGVSIVAYSPLGRGFLTGTIKTRDDVDEMRRIIPRFSEENFPANLRLAEALSAVAVEKGCTPSQLALAWVLAQGDNFIPIPGTKHVKYLKQNAAAVDVELTKEDDIRIRETIKGVGGAKGARYPAAFIALCFADSPELEEATS